MSRQLALFACATASREIVFSVRFGPGTLDPSDLGQGRLPETQPPRGPGTPQTHPIRNSRRMISEGSSQRIPQVWCIAGSIARDKECAARRQPIRGKWDGRKTRPACLKIGSALTPHGWINTISRHGTRCRRWTQRPRVLYVVVSDGHHPADFHDRLSAPTLRRSFRFCRMGPPAQPQARI
jgi:hypothetical protein